MTVTFKGFIWTVLVTSWAGVAAAQQTGPASGAAHSPSSNAAQAEAGEPRADTLPAPQPAEPAASSTPTKPAAVPVPASRTGPVATARTGGAAPKSTAVDRMELGTATVTGDREQPKVMYIVPWKKSDIGDLSGKPMNSLLDEALAPVDRDEFKREVIYYQAVKADASQNGASRSPAKQGEK
jgi:hypothetical protein